MDNFFYNNSSLPLNAVSYISRKADNDLIFSLKNKQFCCVFSPRMMGKTSLMKKVNADMRKNGYLCTEIDASAFIDPIDESWYYMIFDKMLLDFNIKLDLKKWWEEHLELVSSLKFIEFIKVVIENTDREMVIFIDEVDSYIKYITEDKNSVYNNILSAILYFHYERKNNKEFYRVNFCLFGLQEVYRLLVNNKASASSLVSIQLRNFNENEIADAFASVFVLGKATRKALINRIYYWTNGHPYLTQTLCKEIIRLKEMNPKQIDKDSLQNSRPIRLLQELFSNQTSSHTDVETEKTVNEIVDSIVSSLFLDKNSGNIDINLSFIEDCIHKHPMFMELINRYQAIDKKTMSKGAKPDQTIDLFLCFTGLTKLENNEYVTNNRIYQEYFNHEWYSDLFNKQNPFETQIKSWKENGESDLYLLNKTQLKQAKTWSKGYDLKISKYEEKYIEESQKRFQINFFRKFVVLFVALLIFLGGISCIYILVKVTFEKKELVIIVQKLAEEKKELVTEKNKLEEHIKQLAQDSIHNKKQIDEFKKQIGELETKLKEVEMKLTSYAKKFQDLRDSIKAKPLSNTVLAQNIKLRDTVDMLKKTLNWYLKKILVVTSKNDETNNEVFSEDFIMYFKSTTKLKNVLPLRLYSAEFEQKKLELEQKKEMEFARQSYDLIIFMEINANKERIFDVYTPRNGKFHCTLGYSKGMLKARDLANLLAESLMLKKQ